MLMRGMRLLSAAGGMKKLALWLKDHPVVILVGLIATVLGLAVSIVKLYDFAFDEAPSAQSAAEVSVPAFTDMISFLEYIYEKHDALQSATNSEIFRFDLALDKWSDAGSRDPDTGDYDGRHHFYRYSLPDTSDSPYSQEWAKISACVIECDVFTFKDGETPILLTEWGFGEFRISGFFYLENISRMYQGTRFYDLQMVPTETVLSNRLR